MEVVGIVSGIASLVGFVSKVTKSVNDLAERYNTSDILLESLVTDGRMIEFLLPQVRDLIDQPENIASIDANFRLALNDSLAACERVFREIERAVRKVRRGEAAQLHVASRDRFRALWNDQKYQRLQTFLHSYVAHLNVFINILGKRSIDNVAAVLKKQVIEVNDEVAEAGALTQDLETDPEIELSGSIFRLSARRALSLNTDRAHREPETAAADLAVEIESGLQGGTSMLPSNWSIAADQSSYLPTSRRFPTEQAELFEAIASQDYDKVAQVLADGKDYFLPTRNADGHTPVLQAVHNGDLKILQMLGTRLGLEAECHKGLCRGHRPLHVAVGNDDLQCLGYLLEHGANAHAKTRDSQNALHVAALGGSTNVLQLLTQHDIPWTDKDRNGDLPIHCAIRHKRLYFLQTLNSLLPHFRDLLVLPNRDGKSVLVLAVEEGWIEGLEFFSSIGTDATRLDPIRATLMHVAARCSILPAIPVLRNYGLDFHSRDVFGMTPLHHAVLSSHEAGIPALLLQSGADIEARAWHDPFWYNAFQAGDRAKAGDAADRKLLEKYTMKPVAPGTSKHRPDVRSVLENFRNTGRIDVGVQKLDTNAQGPTPLLLAALYANHETYNLLLEENADLLAQMACGCSCLTISRSNDDYRIFVESLRRQMSSPSEEGSVDLSPKVALTLFVVQGQDMHKVYSSIRGKHGIQPPTDVDIALMAKSAPECGHGVASLQAFQGLIQQCREEHVVISGTLEHLGNLLVDYLVQHHMIDMLTWLLKTDTKSSLRKDVESAYKSLRESDRPKVDSKGTDLEGGIELEPAELNVESMSPHRREVYNVLDKSYDGTIGQRQEAQWQKMVRQRQRDQQRKDARSKLWRKTKKVLQWSPLFIYMSVLLVCLTCMIVYWLRLRSITTANGACLVKGCETMANMYRNGAVASICVIGGMLLLVTMALVLSAKPMSEETKLARSIHHRPTYKHDSFPVYKTSGYVHFVVLFSMCFAGPVICWHKFRLSRTECTDVAVECLSGTYRFCLKITGSVSVVGLIGSIIPFAAFAAIVDV